ncbi:MAG: TIGR02186 family protein, partial [Pseudomonadota bacterium]
MRLIQTGLLKRLVGLAVGASAVLLFGVGANAQFRFNSQFNSQFQAPSQFRPATNLQTLEGSTERPLIRVQSSGRAKGPESERVEADVSTRSVSITSSFTGVEIVVFGAIDNAQTLGPDAGLYDIVVVVKGRNQTLTVRQKNWRAGIWINTRAVKFD